MIKDRCKIILAIHNRLFREGIKYYLQDFLYYDVIREVSNGKDLLAENYINRADVLILDTEMLDKKKEVTRRILTDFCDIKIIALQSYDDHIYLKEIIQIGFKACVYKNSVYDQLDTAIKKVLEGKYYFPDNIELSTNINLMLKNLKT